MSAHDGGLARITQPAVVVVFFGPIDPEIRNLVLGTLRAFFDQFRNTMPVLPIVVGIDRADPGVVGGKNSDDRYISALDTAGGNLTIGVTRCGLWATYPFGRFVFARGGNGAAILSLHRFLHDTQNRTQAMACIRAEIPKIVALACFMDSCGNTSCSLAYHWQISDFFSSSGICPACHAKFSEVLPKYLKSRVERER